MRRIPQEVNALVARHAGITSCRFALDKSAGGAFEAHLELLLPQSQVIVNGQGPDPSSALHAALEAAERRLEARACAAHTTQLQ